MNRRILQFILALLIVLLPAWARGQDNPGAVAYAAQKDIEVGTFYMHKGDMDAAIDRFRDAIQKRPTLAKAHLLLAEAYEKKGDKEEAVKAYEDYLTVFPTSPEGKKIKKRIEKLNSEIARPTARR